MVSGKARKERNLSEDFSFCSSLCKEKWPKFNTSKRPVLESIPQFVEAKPEDNRTFKVSFRTMQKKNRTKCAFFSACLVPTKAQFAGTYRGESADLSTRKSRPFHFRNCTQPVCCTLSLCSPVRYVCTPKLAYFHAKKTFVTIFQNMKGVLSEIIHSKVTAHSARYSWQRRVWWLWPTIRCCT